MLSWAFEHSWWTAPLDVRRRHPRHDTRVVTAQQVTALVGRLGAQDPVPLVVFDAGDDPITLTWHLGGVRAQLLVGIRADQVFYTDPPARAAGRAGTAPGSAALIGTAGAGPATS